MLVFLEILLRLSLSHALAIQGGSPVSASSVLAKSEISLGDLSSGTLFRSYCSGTLISNHAIVTAAHCLIGKNPAQTLILFGVNGLTTSVTRTGEKIIIPSQYVPYGDLLPDKRDNFDIGILFFSGELPENFSPAFMVDQELAQNQIPIKIAGFGLPNAGILNQCVTRVINDSYSRSEFQLKGDLTCSPATRDSGGPDFRIKNGKVYLYGIHNWGWHDQNGNPNYSVEARISFYAPWIRQLINQYEISP